MFSHVVIFWTDPAIPDAADRLIAGGEKLLKSIPGVMNFHLGRRVTSDRPVVDKSYQVALNLQFADPAALDAYQNHPQHVAFVETILKKVCQKILVYDFE